MTEPASPFELPLLFLRHALAIGLAMAFLGGGFAVAQGLSLLPGIALAFIGGLWLWPFMEGYVALLERTSPLGLRVLRMMALVGVPVNLVLIALGFYPDELWPTGDGMEATLQAVLLYGWVPGSVGVLILTLLRRAPANPT